MRKYETVFISDPDLQDQTRTELFDKVRNIIAKENGILLDFDEWGNKKLAYEIKKKLRGHYVCITYGGTGELVKELERNFRLSDSILKFMTLLLSDEVTAEQLEKELEESTADSEPAQAVEEAPEAEQKETQTSDQAEDAPEEAAQEAAPEADESAEKTAAQTE